MLTEYVPGSDPDFLLLSRALDEDLSARLGHEQASYTPYNRLEEVPGAVLIYDANRPVACGAYKAVTKDVAEVKRMFVDPSYRRMGLAKTVLTALEERAIAQGFQRFRLETNRRFQPAIALYQGMGFVEIPNYPPYDHMPQSICMEKELCEV